ncbi:hypothetical protein B296_00004292 [Ensete ventricosum]|uniref:Uncharacterized protein n=1 Tax=Ensete ventricosum TaxID=4639 RepID=A0A427AVU1_ENSVE|nr:hypothetical protein B296_00004292 [Ensete ventricosum]
MNRSNGWLWYLLRVLIVLKVLRVLIVLKVLFVLRFFNGFDYEKPPFLATMFAAPGFVAILSFGLISIGDRPSQNAIGVPSSKVFGTRLKKSDPFLFGKRDGYKLK